MVEKQPLQIRVQFTVRFECASLSLNVYCKLFQIQMHSKHAIVCACEQWAQIITVVKYSRHSAVPIDWMLHFQHATPPIMWHLSGPHGL